VDGTSGRDCRDFRDCRLAIWFGSHEVDRPSRRTHRPTEGAYPVNRSRNLDSYASDVVRVIALDERAMAVIVGGIDLDFEPVIAWETLGADQLSGEVLEINVLATCRDALIRARVSGVRLIDAADGARVELACEVLEAERALAAHRGDDRALVHVGLTLAARRDL